MIRIENVYKRFGKNEILHDVSLDLSKGDGVALIGPNACGKTTLIKSILGMVIPDSGNIVFNEKKISSDFTYRRHIGYMPQIGRYPDSMTVKQVMDLVKEIRGAQPPFDEELPIRFHLEEHYQKKMNTLSGGTTQKVSATIAFLFNPDVLILDEPTAGLDPLASEILREKIISEKKKGKLIIITSHLLSELDELINSIIFMQEGRIIFHKSVQELKLETGEERMSKAIAHLLKEREHG